MVKEIFERTKESIGDFTSNHIDNLSYLIPVLIVLITGVIIEILQKQDMRVQVKVLDSS